MPYGQKWGEVGAVYNYSLGFWLSSSSETAFLHSWYDLCADSGALTYVQILVARAIRANNSQLSPLFL